MTLVVKIWSLATGVCEISLNGHTRQVIAIVVIDELRICSCSWNRAIHVFNIRSGVCETSIEIQTICRIVLLE
jgi:WD40 repeat protein